MPETTLLIKASQMWLEINMEPAYPALTGNRYCFRNEAMPNTLPLHIGVDSGIQNPGVDAAIPCEVYKANQAFSFISTDEREAPREYGLEIAPRMIGPGSIKQIVQRLV
jgi:hypothetical protein